MQWIIWDKERNGPSTIMNRLPPDVEGKSQKDLKNLGFLRLFTDKPEDYIPRFPNLLGSAKFVFDKNGDVHQVFPEADYSIASVKTTLKELALADASRVLSATDWYIVRSVELGTPAPDDILALRKRIRDHADWIKADIDKRKARELVDYTWSYPERVEEYMVDGERVVYTDVVVPPDTDTPLSPEFGEELGIDVPVKHNKGQRGKPPEPKDVAVARRASTSGKTLETPVDDNFGLDEKDLPITSERYPYLVDPAPIGDARTLDEIVEAINVPIVPPGDIRTMDEKARRALSPELRERLEEKEIERQKREKDGPN